MHMLRPAPGPWMAKGLPPAYFQQAQTVCPWLSEKPSLLPMKLR